MPGRASGAEAEGAVLEAVTREQVDRTGGREITLVREVRSLGDLDPLDGLRVRMSAIVNTRIGAS